MLFTTKSTKNIAQESTDRLYKSQAMFQITEVKSDLNEISS